MTVPLQFDTDGVQWVWKDPDARLDYLFDWAAKEHGNWTSDWLQPGEIITGHQVTVPTGITLVSDNVTLDQKSVDVWLEGGTECESYDIECEITTNQGRTDERTGRIKVKER